jgi:hypothetical protein
LDIAPWDGNFMKYDPSNNKRIPLVYPVTIGFPFHNQNIPILGMEECPRFFCAKSHSAHRKLHHFSMGFVWLPESNRWWSTLLYTLSPGCGYFVCSMFTIKIYRGWLLTNCKLACASYFDILDVFWTPQKNWSQRNWSPQCQFSWKNTLSPNQARYPVFVPAAHRNCMSPSWVARWKCPGA